MTSAERTHFYSAWGPDEVHLVWGHRGDELVLGPGETVALDPLYLAAGTIRAH